MMVSLAEAIATGPFPIVPVLAKQIQFLQPGNSLVLVLHFAISPGVRGDDERPLERCIREQVCVRRFAFD
jgi:hypothetical protein